MQCKVLLNISKQSMRKQRSKSHETKLASQSHLGSAANHPVEYRMGCSKEKPVQSISLFKRKIRHLEFMDMDGNLILDKG